MQIEVYLCYVFDFSLFVHTKYFALKIQQNTLQNHKITKTY
jgi:hypothetical protein